MATPPHDLTAEAAVLGAVLVDDGNDALSDIAELLTPAQFYRPAHGEIFSAMLAVADAGEKVDELTVVAELRRQGSMVNASEVTDLADVVPTAANAAHYARMVLAKSQERGLIGIATGMAADAFAGELGAGPIAERAIGAISDVIDGASRDNMRTGKEIVKEAFAALEYRFNHRGEMRGLSTGIEALDVQLGGGLQDNDLIIVAGRPSMGKTALAFNFLEHVTINLGKVGVAFSLEMGSVSLIERVLASVGRVDGSRIMSGDLAESAWPKLARAASLISNSGIRVDDSGSVTIQQIAARCRRLQRREKIGLVVVDYIQIMGSNNRGNREQEISEISRGLKALAKELHCPVVALSQLNRKVEERADKRPMMSDLRESGAIEQDADVVLLMYRDEYYNKQSPDPGVAEINVGKQRKGPTGVVRAKWSGQYTQFSNL